MIIDLTKKIAEMKKTEKAQHIETILSFKDFENMEVADLRTIASVIETYQKEQAILKKAELIKEKYSLYSKVYFNDSDDEIESLLNAMEIDDEARFIYHLQNEFDVILKNKTPKRAINRIITVGRIKKARLVRIPNKRLLAMIWRLFPLFSIKPKARKICRLIKGKGGMSVYIDM